MTNDTDNSNPERRRLERQRQGKENWRLWGPYLAERAWGTVREDYSPDGSAWDDFDHDQARSRAYRWNEDGMGGICDEKQHLCFAIALWNGNDPILKERAFGLTGNQGNHGEDVKEYYFYLDATPSHSYLSYLYKYPQSAYPYAWLVEENARRSRAEPPFDLLDGGVFHENRYWDIQVYYAKAAPDEIHVRIDAYNRGPDTATLDIINAKYTVCCCWSRRQASNAAKWCPTRPRGCTSCWPGHRSKRGSRASELQVIMEATGPYHETAAHTLYEAGATVTVVNPKQLKDYAKGIGHKVKNDDQDALALADYGANRRPRPWQPPPPEFRQLHALLQRLEALEQELQRERNRQEKATVSAASTTVLASLERVTPVADPLVP